MAEETSRSPECPVCRGYQTVAVRIRRCADKDQENGPQTLYLRCVRCAHVHVVER